MDKHAKKLENIIAELKKQLFEISNKLEVSQHEVDLLNHIIASMPGHIYWVDREGYLLGCNNEQARNIGLSSRLDVIGKNIYDFQPKENADEIIANNKNIIQSGDPKIIEEPDNLANGNKKIYLSHKAPLKDGNGNIVGIIGISTDITDKKLLEKELKKEKEKAKEKAKIVDIYLSNILRYLPGNIYWMDREGRIIGCNEQQAKCFGLDKASDLIGKNIFDVAQILGWDNSIPESIRANDEKIMEIKHREMLEETVILNGEERVYLAHKAPLCDENNCVIGIVGTGTDITNRKRMEENLKKVLEKTTAERQADLEINRLSKQIAHDIRTPLLALESMADDFEEKNEEKSHILRKIAARINNIANSFLEMTKTKTHDIHKSSYSIQREELLFPLVEGVILEKRIQCKNVDINITFHVDDNARCVCIKLNASDFMRVISNLLDNAVQAIENNKGVIDVLIKKSHNHLRIEISDSGCGIPHDKLQEVFKEGVSIGKREGHGYGLSYTRSFINNVHGKLDIRSEVNKGTLVSIDLSISKTPQWLTNTCIINKVVYVIDDDPSISDVFEKKLNKLIQHKDFDFKIYKNPEEFIQKYDKNRFSTIFLDYHFSNSKYTGISFLRERGEMINNKIYIITNDYDSEELRNDLEDLDLKMIPKPCLNQLKMLKNFEVSK